MRKRATQLFYDCSNCGKLTRETGYSESYAELCLDCYLEAGEDNQTSDNSGAE